MSITKEPPQKGFAGLERKEPDIFRGPPKGGQMPERKAPEKPKVPVIAGGSICSCGWWTLDKQGLLSITGDGRMDDFGFDYKAYRNMYGYYGDIYTTPWWWVRDKIFTVHISCGVTNIGAYAFYDCKRLVRIDIPPSVTRIHSNAFENCKALGTIIIPKNVTYIAHNAFKGCNNLRHVVMPARFKSRFFELEFGIYRGFVEFRDIDC